MSLDVSLFLAGHAATTAESGIFIRRNGATEQITRAEWDVLCPDREPVIATVNQVRSEVYTANITHNLNTMAAQAGIYEALWRPEEIGITKAAALIPLLSDGLNKLHAFPETYKAFNPPNGWGNYGGLVRFVEGYLNACRAYPEADIHVSR